MILDLTPDELLTTTRAVRKRLDLDRSVERSVIEECLEVAMQAPTGANRQDWHWVVVTDPDLRAKLAAIYREGARGYLWPGDDVTLAPTPVPPADNQQARVVRSARYLAEHLHRVPVHVIPCVWGRFDDDTAVSGGLPFGGTARQAGFWGSIFPAVWSFQLALRARGLGSSLTTFHLRQERRVGELLGIPHQRCTQAALLPVAHTIGTDFKPARRRDAATVIHWDRW